MDDLVLVDTKNQTWKDDKTRFGFKMLQKMGWKEDKGLGKNDTGTVTSIKVSKREEGLGLGMEKVSDNAGALGWNSTAKSFSEVLKMLNDSYGKPKKSKKSKKNNLPIISAGMKYKKHLAAKDLKNKTPAELKAIFGHSVVSSSSAPQDATSEELIKSFVEDKMKLDKIKKLKRRKSNEDNNDVIENLENKTQLEDKKIKEKKREKKEAEVGESQAALVEEEENIESNLNASKKDKKRKKKLEEVEEVVWTLDYDNDENITKKIKKKEEIV